MYVLLAAFLDFDGVCGAGSRYRVFIALSWGKYILCSYDSYEGGVHNDSTMPNLHEIKAFQVFMPMACLPKFSRLSLKTDNGRGLARATEVEASALLETHFAPALEARHD
jgi:hypothetical protein